VNEQMSRAFISSWRLTPGQCRDCVMAWNRRMVGLRPIYLDGIELTARTATQHRLIDFAADEHFSMIVPVRSPHTLDRLSALSLSDTTIQSSTIQYCGATNNIPIASCYAMRCVLYAVSCAPGHQKSSVTTFKVQAPRLHTPTPYAKFTKDAAAIPTSKP
jgi:hypothetical protein